MKNAIAKINASESDEVFYQDNVRSIEEKHKQGIASLLDIHDAALKRDISLFAKKEAIYDYLIAQSNFDKATGGI